MLVWDGIEEPKKAHMKLERPIVFIDTETTGIDISRDRIIEFGAATLMPDGERKTFRQRFNPGIPISPEATAVHGITDADVANEPAFGAFADKILRGLLGKDIAGYNLRRLDLPLLDEELRSCGLKLDMYGVRVIDCFGIFSKKEPRKLEDAVRRYCGRAHEGAHGAEADAVATLDVFLGQMSAYQDLAAMDLPALATFSSMSEVEYVDLAGKLYQKDGVMYFAFGKHRGELVADHLDYANWMLDKDFPGSTRDALNEEIRRVAKSRVRQ